MLELVQVHGYTGTGLNTVLARSGAPKGSLYFHFPDGKEQLGEAAIDLAAELFADLIAGGVQVGAAPTTAGAIVEAMVLSLGEMLEESEFAMGCPVSVVALEMSSESERLRTACERAYERWIVLVADFLGERGSQPAAARTTASSVVSLVEGAMIVARTRRDVQSLRDAASTLRTLLDLSPAVSAGAE